MLYHAAVSLREVQAALVVQDMHGIGEKSWAYRWTEYVESCGQRPHMPTLAPKLVLRSINMDINDLASRLAATILNAFLDDYLSWTGSVPINPVVGKPLYKLVRG